MGIEQLLFTDCRKGDGFDPEATGLQIKACSVGLDADIRWQLGRTCMHLGQAFSPAHGPADAIEQEQAWLMQTAERERVPDEVLAKFPIIWSYESLTPDVFALIRTHYLGLANDGRTGNFLAHAFVFNPEDLKPCHYHPLALSSGDLFDEQVPEERTLPTLLNLEVSGALELSYALLQSGQYGLHLPALLTAFGVANRRQRPLLLGVADWRQATPLLTLLAQLLPPSRRCRLTFCTYESERSWVIPTKTGRAENMVAAHDVLVLCPGRSTTLALRPDEYQARYTVFNFVDEQFSDVGEPTVFAAFVASCVQNNQLDVVWQLHGLIEQLGVTDEVAAWDLLASLMNNPSVEIWSQVRSTLVEPYLAGEWGDEKQSLVRVLAALLPVDRLPTAAAWLNHKLLDVADLEAAAYEAQIVKTVYAMARCPDPKEAMFEVLDLVEVRFTEPVKRGVLLGQLVGEAEGTPVVDDIFRVYEQTVQELKKKQRRRLYGQLTQAGCVSVLSREIFRDVWPWQEPRSSKRLQYWHDVVLKKDEAVLTAVCEQTIPYLNQQTQHQQALSLAQALLKRGATPPRLYESILLTLPLVPLPETWEKLLSQLPDSLSSGAKARYAMMRFMRVMGQKARKVEWAMAHFPATDPAWTTALPQLSRIEQQQALKWCLNTFSSCGISTPDDARRLVHLLAAAAHDTPAEVVKTVMYLLQGRDPVTTVGVMMIFARCGFDGAGQDAYWYEIVARLFENNDRMTQQLFIKHLAGHFGHRSPAYEAQLGKLRVVIGVAPPVPATPHPPVNSDGKQKTITSDLLHSLKQKWQTLTNRVYKQSTTSSKQDK